MTDAERKLLELAVSGEPCDAARIAVLAERLPDDLREQAIRARMDLKRAAMRDSAIWEKLGALGWTGRTAVPNLWDEIERVAMERLEASK